MKKISDETAAAIFLFAWLGFMYLGVLMDLIGSNIGWYLFGIDTAVQITILYFEEKLKRKQKELNRVKEYFRRISADYVDYIRSHSYNDNTGDSQTATVIEMTKRVDGKKTHTKYSKKAG